jgi:hypothetical protein
MLKRFSCDPLAANLTAKDKKQRNIDFDSG